MAHGVKLEIAECNGFHLAVGRMVIDPVLIAAKTIACIQHRRMLVSGSRQMIEPAAGQRAETMKMRLQPSKIIRLEIKLEQAAQAAIDRIKILPGAIRRDMIGAAIEILCVVERFGRSRCVHVLTSLLVVRWADGARFTMKRDMTAQTDQYRFPTDYSTTNGQLGYDVFGSSFAES
jgi:hypothetical protein